MPTPEELAEWELPAGEPILIDGWVLGDAGRHLPATHYYLAGITAAHAAGDTMLAANLISTLAYQVSNVGNLGNAVCSRAERRTGSRSGRQDARCPARPIRSVLRLDWCHG